MFALPPGWKPALQSVAEIFRVELPVKRNNLASRLRRMVKFRYGLATPPKRLFPMVPHLGYFFNRNLASFEEEQS